MNLTTVSFFVLLVLWSMAGLSKDVSYSQDNSSVRQLKNDLLSGKYITNTDSFVELKRDISISVSKDKLVKTVQQVRYYPTVGAAHNWGTGTIYFNGYSSKVILKSAATLKVSDTDVQVSHINESDLKVLDSDSYNTFTEGKEILIPYPNLVAGSYTVLEYEIIKDASRNVTDWFEVYYPQNLFERKIFSLNVSWKNIPAPNFVNTSQFVECEESTAAIQCAGIDIPPAQSDDVVSWPDELGKISIGSVHDWDDVTTRMKSYFDDSFGLTEVQLKKVSDSLGLSHLSTEEGIAALHQFVSRDIRYLSRSENGHSIIPHKTSESLELGYGDCKDKSALLIELLGSINVDAYPVLVDTESRRLSSQRLPSLAQFNHVIVCLELDGEKYCLDGTDPYTYWDRLSTGNQGKYALTIKPGMKPELLPIDESISDLDVNTQITFNASGGQKEIQTRIYTGHSASRYRSALASYSEHERKELLVENYQRVVSSTAKPDIEYTDGFPASDSFSIRSSTQFEPFIDMKSDLSYIENDVWIKDEITYQMVSNKHYSQHVFGANIKSIYEFDLGEHWTLTVPTATLDLASEFGSMARSVRFTNKNTIQITTQLTLHSMVIEVDKIEAYNQFLSILENESVLRFYGTLANRK